MIYMQQFSMNTVDITKLISTDESMLEYILLFVELKIIKHFYLFKVISTVSLANIIEPLQKVQPVFPAIMLNYIF